MKYLVETTGDFGLLDLFGGQDIQALRPTVVRMTPFIEANRPGRIKVIEELTDEATDDMLAGKDDMAAAIAALPRPKKAPVPPAKK